MKGGNFGTAAHSNLSYLSWMDLAWVLLARRCRFVRSGIDSSISLRIGECPAMLERFDFTARGCT
jgi:hypothetical protein